MNEFALVSPSCALVYAVVRGMRAEAEQHFAATAAIAQRLIDQLDASILHDVKREQDRA